MTLRLFLDEALTQPVSTGDMSNPDQDVFNGSDGDSKDRRLFLANERSQIADALGSEDNLIHLLTPAFEDTATITVGAEQLRILAGGGTSSLNVERGINGTTAATHESGALVLSAFNYRDCSVQGIDTEGTDEASWIRVAATQGELDTAQPGARLNLGDKPYLESLAFWRRVTVPAGTPVQNKTDLKIRVSAMESPIV